MDIKVKKLDSFAKTPVKAYDSDAGLDLFSIGSQYQGDTEAINPYSSKLIDTGIAMAIPEGYCGIIKDKSGLALKEGLTILGGVIDSSYRDSIKVIVHNTSDFLVFIDKGQKIAQLLILPVPEVNLVEVEDLDGTDRGTGGFGSTGL